MKKILFLSLAVAISASLSSCSFISNSDGYTATKAPVELTISSRNVVDLEVSPVRVSNTFLTTKAMRDGGLENCKNAAVQDLLKKNGNADVLVAPEYSYDKDLNSITVSGYPAKYKNFRSAN